MERQALKDLRDQAAGKVITTAAAIASDPVGTARGMATGSAKSAMRLPVRAGLAATGPAVGVLTRAFALAGSALRTGRQVRDRILPGHGDAGWSGPADVTTAAEPAVDESAAVEPAVERAAEPAPDAATPVTPARPTVAASEPEPPAPEAAVVAGAPGTADAAVARAEQAVSAAAPSGASLGHEELPLPDYDHLTLPALRARLTRLDLTSLVQLRDYEKAHANRLPVVTMLDNRIAKVTASNGN
jgi:hypothetical protein